MRAKTDIIPAALRLYGILDVDVLAEKDLQAAGKACLAGGVSMVQLRAKHASDGEMLRIAGPLHDLCQAADVPFIINDRVALAAELMCGVHVGQEDMSVAQARKMLGPDAIIGASARSAKQAQEAQAQGADYVGCGAVFGTSTKLDAKTVGIQGLQAVVQAVHIPVVAIGGVSLENIGQLKDSGIAGVAVISAVFGQEDIEAAAQKLVLAVDDVVFSGSSRHVLCLPKSAGEKTMKEGPYL